MSHGAKKQTIQTGGGSSNDKGYFADITALNTAYPTGSDGWYAVIGSTDTIWIWDSGTSAWVDSGAGGSGTPGGADTQIQFNDGGAFGGSANFTFDKTTGTAGLNGSFSVVGGTGLSGNGGGGIFAQGADDSDYGTGSVGIGGGNATDGYNGGNAEVSGGNADANGNGGNVLLRSGSAGNVSGDGGNFEMIAGNAITGIGGNFTMTGGSSSDGQGGGLNIGGGNGGTGGAGGEANIYGGRGGDFGNGGNIYQFGGSGGQVFGNGGNTNNYGGNIGGASIYGNGGNAENYGGIGTNGGSVGGYAGNGWMNGGYVGIFGGGGFIGGDISFGAGEGATGDVGLTVTTINNAGTGYTVLDVITVAGGTGCEIVVLNVGGSGEVTVWTQRSYGTGYIAGGTGLTTTGGTGTGFTVDATLLPARHGKVILEDPIGGGVELNTSLLTVQRVATFQDGDGTLAYLSDITGGLQLPTYTVGAVGTDYPGYTDTAIQSALDAGNGKIFLTDGTYVLSTGLKFKSNYQYIEGNLEKCIIQFNGATVPTAISPNATNFKQCGIKGVSIQQTNATVQGTALDLSDMAIMDVDVEIKDAGVAVKMNDANNNTFYNKVNIKAFGCIRGIELNGANPSNHNYFSGRIANKSGGDYGIYIVKGQGNSFKNISLEPVATTGNTGIYLTSASAYANTFENVWIEGNNVGITIDNTVTYNTFIGGTITSNSTNLIDNGKQTAFYNTQVASIQKTNINPGTVIDNGNASDIAWNIKNNTSFAHVGGALVETELRNASDTSILNRWKHAGTGKFVSALNGATELFSVDSSGSSSTMLSQVQNIITKDTTLNGGFSAYIPSYMEVANGITLTVSDTSYLQVG